jgi:hypothetical protein
MATRRLEAFQAGVHHLIHKIPQLPVYTYVLVIVLARLGLSWPGRPQQ